MPNRNPDSPWNPASAARLTPRQYEEQVVTWLRDAGHELQDFNVEHLEHVTGSGGDYEFDAVARFSLLQGASIVVLVECKRYSRPVERDEVLALWAKLQDVNAHKAIIFATCGFQSGALDFASAHGIATVAFVEGSFLYETRSATPTTRQPPPWAGIPRFAGILIQRDGQHRISCSTIGVRGTDALSDWLSATGDT